MLRSAPFFWISSPGRAVGSSRFIGAGGQGRISICMKRSKPGLENIPTFDMCLCFRNPRTIANGPGRSEEHTSELQSLMHISYAVFCLKKKNKQHLTRSTVTTEQKDTTPI